MAHRRYIYVIIFGLLCTSALQFGDSAHAQSVQVANAPVSKHQTIKDDKNENTVSVITGQLTGTYLPLAQELALVLNDGDNLRVLPVLGTPGPENIEDVLFLKSIDMCMTETDYFDWFKEKDPVLYANIEKRIQYIAKLYNSEFHVVAPKEIISLTQLEGKKVNFYEAGSSADITARRIFRTLGIKVQGLNLDQPTATAAMKKGEISAMVRLAGAPASAFKDIKPEDGLHFVPIAPENLPGGFSGKFSELLKVYLPARLKAEDYPNLIPAGESVSTVASSVVLATYAWEEGTDRYRRMAKFVNAFFDNFQKFQDPVRHNKWKSTNLAAEVPGWTRFKPAAQWLAGKREPNAPAAENTAALIKSFEAKRGKPLSPAERGLLLDQWQDFLAKSGGR